MKGTIYFDHMIQDSQDFGSDDDHMVSRVFFDLEIDGTRHDGLYADLKQPVGGSIEETPIEVSRPLDYSGALNYEAYRQAVEDYFRSLVGAAGSGIRIEGASNVRMRNNMYSKSAVAEFDVEGTAAGW